MQESCFPVPLRGFLRGPWSSVLFCQRAVVLVLSQASGEAHADPEEGANLVLRNLNDDLDKVGTG